ncbi:hypothetical protein B9Z55_028123 [Caenorhabditis nigoni]|uniref:DDE-1 domain-containing protein n=1 Tax=Caenorhabditis nigoni TaxID=1611254 RepID=A0A2G5SCS8_9PELO|nr:hypothetical protein B9Z55_028123 [Caenorhabditis nigoni]
MTFTPCISAYGKLTGKLFVTLHEPKPLRSIRQMVASFTDLHVTHSHSGIMSSRLAEEWMEKCLLPSIPDRSVLLLDLWCGFNSMKLLRAVARKKLEGVTFPHGQRNQAPRFAPLIQRGFYELGIVTTKPTFDTPAKFCVNPTVGKDKCEACTILNAFSITFIKTLIS